MRVAALLSGGKDSVYAAFLSSIMGMDPEVALINVPEEEHPMVYHRPNIHLAGVVARLMGLEAKHFKGSTEEDLAGAIGSVGADALVAGVVASEYQYWFLQEACRRAECTLIAPLWGRDPEELLREYTEAGMEVVITRVAAEGLDRSLLGRTISEVAGRLLEAHRRWGVNPVGEGGEFETLVVGAPWFSGKIRIKDVEVSEEGPFTATLRVLEHEVVA